MGLSVSDSQVKAADWELDDFVLAVVLPGEVDCVALSQLCGDVGQPDKKHQQP